MGCILKFRSPNLYAIIIVTKIKKCFLKKKRINGFFIFFIFYFYSFFIYVLGFKQVESMVKKSPANNVVGFIKFSLCLNFGYCKYGIIFSIQTQNGCSSCMHEEKICEMNNF